MATCPTQSFQNVSQAAWNAIKAAANQQLQPLGIGPISGNSGSLSHEGITLTWNFVPTPAQSNCGNLTFNVSIGFPASTFGSTQQICSLATQTINGIVPPLIAANACPPPTPTPGSVLIEATVEFDNISSGKDNTENFWLYLIPSGTVKTNAVATFAEASYPGPNSIGFSQNQAVIEPLSIGQPPPTFSAFTPQAGGSLRIDVHGNFGGFHNNSDWKTGITLNLTFQQNQTTWALPPIVWPEIDLHSDSTNPSATYSFGFVWDAGSNAFVVA